MTKPHGAVLGPVLCQGCRTPVWWARSQTRADGQVVRGSLWWREQGGRIHKCIQRLPTDPDPNAVEVSPGSWLHWDLYLRGGRCFEEPEP